MADPFNGLISSGMSNALMAGAGMFGQQQAQNAALADRRESRDMQMLQYTMGQDANARSERQQARQFDMQLLQSDRAMSMQREESAFARLNSALDRQLKVAEIESQDRQRAFENTLRAQTFDIQAKTQTAQLEQINGVLSAKKDQRELFALVGGLRTATIDSGAASDSLKRIAASGNLAWLPQAEQEAAMQTMSLAGQMLTSYDISPEALPGAMLSVSDVDAKLGGLDLSKGSFTADHVTALGDILTRSGAASETDTDAKVAAMELYLAKNSGLPHMDSIAKQLKDPAARATLRSQLDTGLVQARVTKSQYAEVFKLNESIQRAEAFVDARDPLWRVKDDEDSREIQRGFQEARQTGLARILSGGNPRAELVADGMVNNFMDDVHAQIREGASAALRVNFELVTPPRPGIPPRSIVGGLRRAVGLVAAPGTALDYRQNVAALDAAAQRLNDVREAAVLYGNGPVSPELMDEAITAHGAYVESIKNAYAYAGGQAPIQLLMLADFKRVFPMRVARRMDEAAKARRKAAGVEEYVPPLTRLLSEPAYSSPTTVAAAPSAVSQLEQVMSFDK